MGEGFPIGKMGWTLYFIVCSWDERWTSSQFVIPYCRTLFVFIMVNGVRTELTECHWRSGCFRLSIPFSRIVHGNLHTGVLFNVQVHPILTIGMAIVVLRRIAIRAHTFLAVGWCCCLPGCSRVARSETRFRTGNLFTICLLLQWGKLNDSTDAVVLLSAWTVRLRCVGLGMLCCSSCLPNWNSEEEYSCV